jgi:hypothetical protein
MVATKKSECLYFSFYCKFVMDVNKCLLSTVSVIARAVIGNVGDMFFLSMCLQLAVQ